MLGLGLSVAVAQRVGSAGALFADHVSSLEGWEIIGGSLNLVGSNVHITNPGAVTQLRIGDATIDSGGTSTLAMSILTILQEFRLQGKSDYSFLSSVGDTLTDLQIGQWTSLTFDFSIVPLLTNLFCDNNPNITTLDFSPLTHIASIYAAHCTAATSIVLTGLDELEGLDVDDTPISSIDLSDCLALENVHFGQCANLLEVDFTGLTNFTTFTGYPPNVTTLNFTGCTSLAALESHLTSITSVTIAGCTSLLNVNFQGASLSDCDTMMIELDNLGLSNGTIDVSGGANAALGGAGLAAKANLEGRGCTVANN